MITEPIRGIRSWRLNPDGTLVGSWGGIWVPGQNTAECRRATTVTYFNPGAIHLARCSGVALKCTCGFYAFWSGFFETITYNTIVGVISGWGKTIIHDKGFRSEHAKILALAPNRGAVPVVSHRALKAIGSRYQAATFPNIETLISEFPPDQEAT